jgi:protease-4
LIVPDVHVKLQEIVSAHMSGGEVEKAQHEMASAMPANPVKRTFQVEGATAVIPIDGIIGRKFSDMLQESGVCSIDIAERMLNAAASDNEINNILMVFDSPGGQAMGVPEVGETIRRINETKPVFAVADGMMGSAAYWIASQASAIYAMPSADVGSIGVYMAILDQRRRYEAQGVDVDVIKNAGATYKGMGMPGPSLTPEQRAMVQERVDRMGAQLKEVVRQGRGKPISDDTMRGQSFNAEDARRLGLVDSIGTVGDALRDLANYGKMKSAKGKYT